MSEHPFQQVLQDSISVPYDNLVNYSQNTKFGDRLFESDRLRGVIQYSIHNNTLFVTIAGTIHGTNSGTIDYIAPAPITRGYSYAGSGLPYPNPEVAYENSQAVGSAQVDDDGDFTFTIEYPNSYYVRQGTVLLNPHVHLYSENLGRVYTIEVGERIPNKSLTGLSDRYDRSSRR